MEKKSLKFDAGEHANQLRSIQTRLLVVKDSVTHMAESGVCDGWRLNRLGRNFRGSCVGTGQGCRQFPRHRT
jgi:hypothetical protein